jgi:hypothetical protein
MITLNKTPGMSMGTEQGTPLPKIVSDRRRLVGHHEGLRMNDMITLHSALVCLSLQGFTAHLSHCDGTPGQGCINCGGSTF